jgi:hypothetical protein
MTIADLGALGEFIGSLAVVVTVGYLALQIRQSTAQQKREESLSIHQGQNTVISQMMDPANVRAYARVAEGDGSASTADRARAIMWVIQYLNHFQTVYDLHQNGSLDEERYALWEGFAVGMVASKGIRAWWDDESGKLVVIPAVRDLIDARMNDTENPPTPTNERWTVYGAAAWREHPLPEDRASNHGK